MTDLDLAAAQAICDRATPGPWRALISDRDDRFFAIVGGPTVEYVADLVHMREAAFIVAARTGWPEALAALQRVTDLCDQIEAHWPAEAVLVARQIRSVAAVRPASTTEEQNR